MRTSLIASFAIAALVTASGCAHLGLGQPPLETDLINDGTAQSQQALVNEYRVEFKEGWISRPGGDPKKNNVDELKARASSDEAASYLTSSERAGKKMQSAAIGFDRVVSSAAFHDALVLTLAVAGATFAAVVAIPTVVNNATGASSASWDFMGSLGFVGWSMLGGAVGGCLASIPFSLLNSLLVQPLAAALAAPDYQKAATAFNRDLDDKVRQAARPPATAAPASAPATTGSPAAPASESQPAGY